MAMSEHGRKRLLESIQKNSAEEIAELDSPPHGELQPIIDHLERHDEPFDIDSEDWELSMSGFDDDGDYGDYE